MESGTENKPTLDRTLLLPALLGVFSLCGILLVFVLGRYNASRQPLPVPETPTPFKYQLIGTEPGISTSEMTGEETTGEDSGSNGSSDLGLVVTSQQGGSSGSSSNAGKTQTSSSQSDPLETATLKPTRTPTDPIIVLSTSNKPTSTSLPFIFRTYTPTFTPRATRTVTASKTKIVASTNSSVPATTGVATQPVPLVPSSIEYDDAHPLISYTDWNLVSDANAYQGTLHVSSTSGSKIRFRFTGQQFRLNFQSKAEFGTITINVGGLSFDLDESNGTNEWVSILLAQGTYLVEITHASGGSVNLDSIFIPDLNTPTPSITPSPTKTQ